MELQTGTIKIGQFNKLYTSGVIKPYPKNRGGKIFDRTRITKYATNWDTASSGDVIVEKTSDGYVLRDFHNRAEAIKIGVAKKTIKETDTLLIRVLPPGDGFKAYQNINSAKKHTSQEKLSNTDLVFGHQIARVLSKSNAFKTVELPTKFYTTLARAVIDVRVKKRSEYALVNETGGNINRFIDSSTLDAPELTLTEPQIKSIAAAVDFYGVVRDSAQSSVIGKNAEAIVERILGSAQAFGFIVFDYMYNRKLNSADVVGKSIAKHYRAVNDLTRELSQGTINDKIEATRALLTKLNAK